MPGASSRRAATGSDASGSEYEVETDGQSLEDESSNGMEYSGMPSPSVIQ